MVPIIAAAIGFVLSWALSKFLQREGYEGMSLVVFFGGIVFCIYMGVLAIVSLSV